MVDEKNQVEETVSDDDLDKIMQDIVEDELTNQIEAEASTVAAPATVVAAPAITATSLPVLECVSPGQEASAAASIIPVYCSGRLQESP